MRKLFVITLAISLMTIQNAFAEELTVQAAAVRITPATDFAQTYKTSSENLLYLLLAAINDAKYSIEEIQFKTGSVLFKAHSKEFIASVCSKDNLTSFIKIVPADNNYNFSPMLIKKLQNYIESNNSINFQNIL